MQTKKKTTVSLDYQPRDHQRIAHEKRKRFSVLVWHRRSGKTVFAIMELILAALAFKGKNGRFAYIAPYYGQAKAVAWDYMKRFCRVIPGVQIKEGELTVIFTNGSAIRIYGADNPDSLRGQYFDGIVLDEVADMKPNVWGEIIRPALADRQGWSIFIGTPKGMNLFSDLYYRAIENPEWYADLKRVSDTNALPIEEVEKAKREMSKPEWDQEMECDFSASVANALIPLDLALEASKRTIGRSDYYWAPFILGVDVARFGGDKSVIFPRQGLASFKPKQFEKTDTMIFTNHLIHDIGLYKADATFIDVIGVGAGVVDRCRELNQPGIIAVNSGSSPASPKFKNLRAEMWWKMLEWLKDGGVIPNDPELVAELCSLTYWYDSANRLVLEPKEDAKARGLVSPNKADALANTFAVPVTKRVEQDQYNIGRSNEQSSSRQAKTEESFDDLLN